MLHEVKQNADVVVRTLSWILLEELTDTITDDQRLTHNITHIITTDFRQTPTTPDSVSTLPGATTTSFWAVY